MTIKPLTQWKCDSCGTYVDGETGMLEWIEGRDDLTRPKASQFRIAHTEGCLNYGDHPGRKDGHLRDYVGPDGLQCLLEIANNYGHGKDSLENASEFVTIIRRLHVPYFEEARPHFADYAQEEARDLESLISADIHYLERIANRYEK
jgi:hypothetical protein